MDEVLGDPLCRFICAPMFGSGNFDGSVKPFFGVLEGSIASGNRNSNIVKCMTSLCYTLYIKLIISTKKIVNSVNNSCIDFTTYGLVISNSSYSSTTRALERWGYNISTLSSSRKGKNSSISFNLCFLWPISIGVIATTAIAAATGGGREMWLFKGKAIVCLDSQSSKLFSMIKFHINGSIISLE